MGKSSPKIQRQILGVITAARAEQMLAEWANTNPTVIPKDAKAWERLFRRYPEIPSVEMGRIMPVSARNRDEFDRQMGMANAVGEHLRRAWDAPDLRRFEWHTWTAQKKAQTQDVWAATVGKLNIPKARLIGPDDNRAGDTAAFWNFLFDPPEPPTSITPVEAAIFYLRHNRDRALHCPNPECPAPYFFRSKKGQKFCSPECAKPTQRESKRQWWAVNRAKEKTT